VEETTSGNSDPLTSSASTAPKPTGALAPSDLLPFLNDLAEGDADRLPDIITPTLSLFFQQWFKIKPSPDLMGTQWLQYLGAVALLVQSKPIAAIVSWFGQLLLTV
jgi:ubiquitin conjugation factor E4 B